MARTQQIALTARPRTYTTPGSDRLPTTPAQDHLRFLRDDEVCPNTDNAYPAGLAARWKPLERSEFNWREVTAALFGQFLAFVHSGGLPGTTRIGEPGSGGRSSSMQSPAAAAAGAGTEKRLPLLPIQARSALRSALDKATGPLSGEH